MPKSFSLSDVTIFDEFESLKFDEDFQGIVMMGDVESSFLLAVTQKAQAVVLEKTACRTAHLKIERSPVKSIFSSESKELEDWIDKFVEVQAFLDFMRKPPQDLQASLQQSFDAVLEMGFIVSKPYLLRALDASVKYKMLFSVRSSTRRRLTCAVAYSPSSPLRKCLRSSLVKLRPSF